MPFKEAQVPLQPLRIEPIESVSPSSFTSLSDCLLRATSRAARNPDLLPSPQNNRVGTVAHQLLEQVGRGQIAGDHSEELFRRWDGLVAKQEEQMTHLTFQKRFIPLSKHIARYEVMRHGAVKQALALDFHRRSHTEVRETDDQKAARCSPESVFYELPLATSDGKVKGNIDYLRETPEGAILRDYKTGLISERSNAEQPDYSIKPEY